ncbi:hypothetical protein [Actomonas aquatica]|uniref:Uncharacterized protein n=1 Tax=Actomonas aquatica TaxID=2866162 RepID=A0ABZ1CF54_9BACT|nr:hypothetical protein [Opitutus sp. WL0086]WRQ89858.1 hypothetical protein K1X11_010615 [Opitutus sp. WL0086]
MKIATYLITAAIAAPAAILLGASALIVTGVATTVGLSAIAIADYAKPAMTYHTEMNIAKTTRAERHPLAA